MKKILSAVAALVLALSVSAQCSFNPTISPSGLILCPQESDTLWTQVYDSYQWYRGGNPIPGATNQYYVVDYFNDAGYYFTVEATVDTCTEMSPQELVDGWAFLGPYVITDGDPGNIDMNGIQHNCPGDTVLLILGQPYSVNIQWYDGNTPIPGANDDTLIVTQNGNYTVIGAPALCPNFMQQLGVSVGIQFWPVITPVISFSGSTLNCTPSNANAYQWYQNGVPVSGAVQSSYQPTGSGVYTVEITDVYGCRFMSAPFSYGVGLNEISSGGFARLYPNPASERIQIELQPANEVALLIIYDPAGREIKRVPVNNQTNLLLDVSMLEQGMYILNLQDEKGKRIASSRFVKE